VKWEKDGPVAIRSGSYIVNKCDTASGWKYTAVLMGSPSTILGHGVTADEAKALCVAHEKGAK
jgi:hypothetical protein